MLIGICDDDRTWQMNIRDLCERYFSEKPGDHHYVLFSSGEDVMDYCRENNARKIDLLFLDIKIGKISGIDVKEYAVNEPKIRRLVFVSARSEYVYDAFSTKTLGFIPKPASYEKIAGMIDITREERNSRLQLSFKDTQDGLINISVDNITFFEAKGNYTRVNTAEALPNGENSILITRQIGEIDELVRDTSIIRVHRSYLINMDYIVSFSIAATLKSVEKKIPVGRKFREAAKEKYKAYCGQKAGS